MVELDERTRQDLAELRRRHAPAPAAKQRILAALELELGPGPGPDDGEMPDDFDPDPTQGLAEAATASKVSLGYAAKVVGATLALTLAGLGGLRLAAVTARALSSSDPVVERTSPADAPQGSTHDPTPQIPEPVDDPVEPHELAAIEAAPTKDKLAAKPPRVSPATERKPEAIDSLAEEMALLEAAKAASSPKAALVELERHRERFPAGQLTDEREILRLEALCGLRDLEAARAVAEKLLRSKPDSPLRPRIRAACPKLDLEAH